jgi:hypothetical protein
MPHQLIEDQGGIGDLINGAVNLDRASRRPAGSA